MDYRKILTAVAVAALVSACGAKKTKITENAPPETVPVVRAAVLPPPPPAVIPKKTSFTPISVFSGKTFTMQTQSAPISQILFAVCSDIGLNLIIDPGINNAEQLTVSFIKTPAKDALDIIMDMSGLFYEIRGNVLRIKKYSTKHFTIPHIPAVTNFQSDLGGDVLGGSGDMTTDLSSALKGNFNLGYKIPEGSGDFYGQIEGNLNKILGIDNATTGGTEDSYTINKLTGSLSVHTTKKKMKRIEDFLDAVFSRAVKQVQIEAKIVDVTLSDEWAYGIDWSAVFANGKVGLTQALPLVGNPTGIISVVTESFAAAIKALGQYGDLDTLANPKLMVMNGQTALISAGTITPFWEKETYENLSNNVSTLNTNYTRFNVLDGVLVGVTPYVNDDDTVTINIIPVSTSIQGTKSIVNSNNVTEVEAPILNIKEAGTVIRVDDGAMVVMGGLISTVKEVNKTRIPLLGDIPILGYLFRSESHKTSKRELVIFLRPTIVYTSGEPLK